MTDIEAIGTLPLLERRAYTLRKVYGYSGAEIARRLTVSESEAERLLAGALRKVVDAMDGPAVECIT